MAIELVRFPELDSAFQKAATAHGKVDLATTQQVITALRAKNIPSADATTLMDHYDTYHTPFEADAKAAWDRFVDEELGGRVVSDVVAPAGPFNLADNPKASNLTTYQTVPGQAIAPGGVAPDKALQGPGVGDCFLVSSEEAQAEQQPQEIVDHVQPAGPHAYDVTLFEDTDLGKPLTPVVVPVTDELPMSAGQAFYAHDTNPQELWPALEEKAYAKLKGGYDAMAAGGEMTDAEEALTGRRAQVKFFSDASDPVANHQRLQNLLSQHYEVTVGTHDFDPDNPPFEDPDIVFGHAYTVQRAYQQNGQRLVELRNDWGYSTTTKTGCFPISAEKYVRLCEEEDSTPPPPSA